jgi:hypothetical protein
MLDEAFICALNMATARTYEVWFLKWKVPVFIPNITLYFTDKRRAHLHVDIDVTMIIGGEGHNVDWFPVKTKPPTWYSKNK